MTHRFCFFTLHCERALTTAQSEKVWEKIWCVPYVESAAMLWTRLLCGVFSTFTVFFKLSECPFSGLCTECSSMLIECEVVAAVGFIG